MRKAIVAGLAFGALLGPAAAADMYVKAAPPAPVYFSWTGCYVGGDVGGAWSSQDVSNTSPPVLFQAPVTASVSESGVIGGGYVGCNYQFN
jgi:outer membrane immunogenic protein